METSNTLESTKQTKALFTPKKIMKILSLICIVIVFCPVFLVSCSSQVVDVNVMTAVGGMSMYGETVVEPHPIMLLCLLIPIAVLIMLFMKKMAHRIVAIITLLLILIDFIMWLVFKSSVKEIAEENYCKVEVTGWFYLNAISLFLIIALSFLIVIKVLQMDTNLIKLVTGNRTQEAINPMSTMVSQATSAVNKLTSSTENNVEDRIGFCPKCGSGLIYGSRFCGSCGSPIPECVEETIKNAEEEKVLFCQQCGFKLETDAKFCKQCGARIE